MANESYEASPQIRFSRFSSGRRSAAGFPPSKACWLRVPAMAMESYAKVYFRRDRVTKCVPVAFILNFDRDNWDKTVRYWVSYSNDPQDSPQKNVGKSCGDSKNQR